MAGINLGLWGMSYKQSATGNITGSAAGNPTGNVAGNSGRNLKENSVFRVGGLLSESSRCLIP